MFKREILPGLSDDDKVKEITCPMHTASDSPPAAADTLLGWKSIFTTSEALTNKNKTPVQVINMLDECPPLNVAV